MKKILVPTDFSKSAENALRYAVLLADKWDAEIQLIHVVYPSAAYADAPVAIDIMVDEQIKNAKPKMKTMAEKILAQVLQQLDNYPIINSDIEIGSAENRIAQVAEEGEYDLIIMGTGTRDSRLDKFIGSVAGDVIKGAHCPIMIIPEEANYERFMMVAYATNLSESDPYEIWRTAKLLEPFNPIIRCVHFQKKKEKANAHPTMSELRTFFEDNTPALRMTFHEEETDNVVESLIEFVDRYEIDLLVMYKPERTFFNRLFKKSVTKKMVLDLKIPMLIFKDQTT